MDQEPSCLNALLERRAGTVPDAPAILAPGREPLSYGRLFAHVRRTVEILNEMGIGRHDRVATVLPNGCDMAVAFLAVAAGATSAPLNPGYRASDFDFCLTDLKARALLISSDLDSPARAIAGSHQIPVIELSPLIDSAAGLFTLDGPTGTPVASKGMAKPDDVALVLHTSGTTSRPKAVPLTQANVCHSAHNICRTLRLEESDRCLNIMPLFHIHGLVGSLLSSIAAGSSIVCTPGLDPAQFFTWLDDFRPTWYSAVPTMHQAILASAADHRDVVDRVPLRFVRSSSSALPDVVMTELERTFNAPVIESYGMTEAAHQMTSNPLPPGRRKAGSVGLPAGPKVAIMDEAGSLLAPGGVGEIVIQGANVTPGYENNPEANTSAFTNGWFRTGDQGRLDDDGYLFITGRLKEMINRGGEHIAPAEVDHVLLHHPEVIQAVAFPVPHPTLGEDVAAAVVLRSGSTTTEKALRQFAFARLPDSRVPTRILILDRLPQGPTGKLQRIGMADRLNVELSADYAAPGDGLEAELARIWAHVLKCDRVGIDDNFFSLGGDSLLAAHVFVEVDEHFGTRIPLAVLFRAPTIREFAQVLRSGSWSADWSSLVTIQPHGSKPPVFFVHAHGGNVVGYRRLAHHLGPGRPFYGLQAQGLDGSQLGPRRFEDMAAHYITEIRRVQPSGPYLLGGFCLGGVIAYEMAQQLRAEGEEISLLAMVQADHPKYPRALPHVTSFHRWIYRMIWIVSAQVSNVRDLERRERWTRVRTEFARLAKRGSARAERLIRRVLARFGLTVLRHRRGESGEGGEAEIVYADYSPRPYGGPVTLLRAARQPLGIYPDPALGWGGLVRGELEIVEIPGYQMRMLDEPRVRIVADCLRERIERATRGNEMKWQRDGKRQGHESHDGRSERLLEERPS